MDGKKERRILRRITQKAIQGIRAMSFFIFTLTREVRMNHPSADSLFLLRIRKNLPNGTCEK